MVLFEDASNYFLSLQMKSPGLQAVIEGKTKSLYLNSPSSIEEKLRPNLNKTFEGNGILLSNFKFTVKYY